MRRLLAFAVLLAACRASPPAVTGPRDGGDGGTAAAGGGSGGGAGGAGGTARSTQSCYAAAPESRGVGICRAGLQTRTESGYWGPCEGQVLPQAERCGDGVDSDCDGFGGPGADEDVGCCTPAGPEVCNGMDDDCDGLVDDGVTSACGTCPEVPCYVEEIHEPASCYVAGSGRTCTHITELENTVDAMTIHRPFLGGVPPLGLLRAATGEVVFLASWSGEVEDTVPSGAQAPAAVLSDHLGAWVLDAGLDPGGSAVVRIDRLGRVACRRAIPEGALAITSPFYREVIVSTRDARLLSFDLLPEDEPGDGTPACGVVDLVPGDPSSVGLDLLDAGLSGPARSMKVSRAGILWTGTAPALRFDTGDGSWQLVPHASEGPVAIDEWKERAWFGGAELHSVPLDGPYTGRYEDTVHVAGGELGAYGDLWVLRDDGLEHVAPDRQNSEHVPLPVDGPSSGMIWDDPGPAFITAGDHFLVFSRFDSTWDVYEPGLGELIASGARQRASFGTWRQDLDLGWSDARLVRLDWQQVVPEKSAVVATVRIGSSQDALEHVEPCGTFRAPPADLRACPGADHGRFVRIDFLLLGSPRGAPAVGNIELVWTRL